MSSTFGETGHNATSNRIRATAFASKVMSASDAVKFINPGDTVAISGFASAGTPKVVIPALAERIALLPAGAYQPVAHKASPLRVVVPAEAGARPGSYRFHQGQVHRVEGSEMVDVHDQLNATQRGRITGMCAIRDYARTLLDAQLSEGNDGRLGHLRALLNGTYEIGRAHV